MPGFSRAIVPSRPNSLPHVASALRKVLLVDDEAPARQLLREYLAAYPSLVIIGEANNGVDAVRLCGELSPDILFLDVQMPGLTGLQVLEHLQELPQVIFTTAYDAYALEAFDRNAVDYLLKPYTKARFAKAIDKLASSEDANLAKVQALTEHLLAASAPKSYPPKILVPHGSRIAALDPTHILRIEADGDYAQLITAEGSYLSSHGLGELLERLDPAHFYRVHRSAVVNLQHVAEVQRDGSTYYIGLSNGDRVRVSRGYSEVVRGWVV